MNKQELSAKWSQYCNTDKLVDDAMALLTEYGHNNTEQGVCALLDTYFTNKEPLIKLFMTSKNYIGDMRIVVEKEFERGVDMGRVRSFLVTAQDKFYLKELLKLSDENGKTLMDCLCTGKKVLSIDEFPTEAQVKEKMDAVGKFDHETGATQESQKDFNDVLGYIRHFYNCNGTITKDYTYNRARNSPELKKGTKLSRAFNKVCVHYGVDKLHPETVTITENGKEIQKTVYPYNKAFAEFSDLASALVRKMPFIISLNPLDYLTMSHGVSWVSCHNITSGGCMGGTISYMLDKTSIITFVVENIKGDIHKIPKLYRQMYHYDKNLFIQSRLYPQGNDGATDLYEKFRSFVIEEFDTLLEAGGEWTYKMGPNACGKHIKQADYSQHYPDYIYNRSACMFYPVNNEPSIKHHVMTVGHIGICVNCGHEYKDHGRLTHRYSSECRI